MRKQFIAVNSTRRAWSKSITAKKALDGLNYDSLEGVRVIEVTYPDNETARDDIIFYPDGGYELKGHTKAVHYDGETIREIL